MTQASRTLLITGSTIGLALARAFEADASVAHIVYTYRSSLPEPLGSKVTTVNLDLNDEQALAEVISGLAGLDGVIVTAGFLHDSQHKPEKTIGRLSPEGFMKSIEINTLPTLLVAKHTRRLLRKSPHSWFAAVSAKVGSIQDNRLGGWYSYRASKAALNMALKTLAIEWRLALPNCSVAALHPGTVESPLSCPFTKDDATLLSPDESAHHLKEILDRITPAESGRFWSWNGEEIPW
jgi:NAD(P)-dependent dehydrogenase (short-subunit alcohol dehydrogenase family)